MQLRYLCLGDVVNTERTNCKEVKDVGPCIVTWAAQWVMKVNVASATGRSLRKVGVGVPLRSEMYTNLCFMATQGMHSV